jgi:hypothetical protein
MAVRMEVTLLGLESARLTYQQLAGTGQEVLDIVRVGHGMDGCKQQLLLGVSQ